MTHTKPFKEIDEDKLKNMLDSNRHFLFIDVRTPLEFSRGHITGSKNIPIEIFKNTIINMNISLESTIVVYCRTGRKSGIASTIMYQLGFKNVYNFGGICNWHYSLQK